jgi:transposase
MTPKRAPLGDFVDSPQMQAMSGERAVSPVAVPPPEIQALRDLFSAYRLLKKEITQKKCRIHSRLIAYLF